VIAVTAPGKGFWTRTAAPARSDAAPRRAGDHRAGRAQAQIAWQILALNTEKGDNLRERALEVIASTAADRRRRRAAGIASSRSIWKRLRWSRSACVRAQIEFARVYNPIVRRLEGFSPESLNKAIHVHEKHAGLLMELDERVAR